MKNLVLLLLLITFNVLGQLVIKQAMLEGGEIRIDFKNLIPTAIRLFTTPKVILGLALYASGAFVWMIVLSQMELSVAYPMTSISYVLLTVLSLLLFSEKITLVKGIGTGIICLGVLVLSRA